MSPKNSATGMVSRKAAGDEDHREGEVQAGGRSPRPAVRLRGPGRPACRRWRTPPRSPPAARPSPRRRSGSGGAGAAVPPPPAAAAWRTAGSRGRSPGGPGGSRSGFVGPRDPDGAGHAGPPIRVRNASSRRRCGPTRSTGRQGAAVRSATRVRACRRGVRAVRPRRPATVRPTRRPAAPTVWRPPPPARRADMALAPDEQGVARRR